MSKKYKIAVCVAKLNEQTQRDILSTLCYGENSEDCSFVILSTLTDLYFDTPSDYGEASVFRLLEKCAFDAVVVFPQMFNNRKVLTLITDIAHKRQIPLLCVGEYIDGETCITYAYGKGFRGIVEHLIKVHNCKRINFIAGRKGDFYSEERIGIYKSVLEENGIEVENERIGYGDYWDAPTKEVMEKFWESDMPAPQAIICANDIMAMTAVKCLRTKGVQVPRDIIVTGFDGIDMNKFHKPRLTTASLNSEEAARSIHDLLVDMIEGREYSKQTVIEFTESFSESCGCNDTISEANEDTLIDFWNEIDFERYFNNSVMSMSASVLDNYTLEESINAMQKYLQRAFISEMRICLCSDFVKNTDSEEKYNCKQLTDTMYCVIEKTANDTKKADIHKAFDLSSIAPDGDSLLEIEGHLIVLPLYSGDLCYGYVAANTAINNITLHQNNTFCMNLCYALDKMASFARIIAVNRQLELSYTYDNMTGVISRNGYYSVVRRKIIPQIKNNKKLVAVSMDLDNLKEINDTKGHDSGDAAITLVARTLNSYFDKSGICARFGGDEFLGLKLFADDKSAEEFTAHFIETFDENVREETFRQKLDFNVGASYGVYCCECADVINLDEVVKKADALMYKHKRFSRSPGSHGH